MYLILIKIVLFLFYIIVVFPLSILIRLLGVDPMSIKNFGKGDSSVFHVRNHTFTEQDLKNPY